MLPGAHQEVSEIIYRNDEESKNTPVMDAQMFRRYARNRIAAARALNGDEEQLKDLEQKIDALFHPDDFHAFQKAKKEQEEFLIFAKEMAEKGYHRTHQLEIHEAQTQYKLAFDSTYKQAIEKMQHINQLLAFAVDPKKDPAKVIKKINSKADDLRAKQARPTQHNTYDIQGLTVTSSHIPEGWLTSEQEKLYQQVHNTQAPKGRPYTNPSTIRDGRQVGQANAVRTEIKVNDKTVFSGHRHGSPSVLKINNDAQRQHRTLQNVKQMMTLAAIEKISKGEGLTDPLIIDMASMSLLSPVMKGDLLDGMKQYRQVDDSRLAYWSLQGRPITLDIQGPDGKPLNVQLNSTFMSIGVNAVRGVGTPAARQLVQRVNNRGLDQLINNVTKSFDGVADTQLNRVVARINEMESLPGIRDNKEKIAAFDRQPLHQAYAELERCNEALSNPDFTGDLKAVKKERSNALKVINKEEKKLDKLYKNLAKGRETIYKNRVDDLKRVLNQLQETNNYKDNKDFQKMQIFVDALDIYYNQPQPGLKRFIDVKRKTSEKNKILKKIGKTSNLEEKIALRDQADAVQKEIDFLNKSNYRFQARFAMLAAHMDQFVEWFCKSGEDRTGLLNEHIEAFCIFIEKHGHAPRWDNPDDHAKFHELMPVVHTCAPNRRTNQENDDCPGLKVSDPDFEMPTVSYYTDKKMANIVKESTKIGLSLKEKLQQALHKIIGVDPVHSKATFATSRINQAATARQPVIDVSLSLPENRNQQSATKNQKKEPSELAFSTSYLPSGRQRAMTEQPKSPAKVDEPSKAKDEVSRRKSNKFS